MVQNEIMIVECLGCGDPIHPKRLEILPNTNQLPLKTFLSIWSVGKKKVF